MKIKVKVLPILFLCLVSICGIGYAYIDKFQEILTGMLIIVLALYGRRRPQSRYATLTFKHSPYRLVCIVFVLLILYSATYSISRNTTINHFIRFMLITILVLFEYSDDFINKSIKALNKTSIIVSVTVIISVAFPSLFGIAFGWVFINKDAVYRMINTGSGVGIIGHNAYAACISNLCIGFFVSKYFSHKKCNTIDWIALIIGLIAVFATGKRIAFISIAVVLFAMLLIRTDREKKKKVIKFALIGVFFAVIIYVLVPIARITIERFIEGMGDTSFNNRLVFWNEALSLFDQKKLFGWGFGIFPYYDKTFGSGWGYSTHNQYLEVLAELGIVGTIIFVLVLLVCLHASVKLLVNKEIRSNDNISMLVIFIFYYQMWYIVYGLSGVPLYNYSQHFLFILLSSCGLSLYKRYIINGKRFAGEIPVDEGMYGKDKS